MEKNYACGNAPSDAADTYLAAHEKSRSDIFNTISNALDWVPEKGMREYLSRSDFKMEELRTYKTTIYVVLDYQRMEPEQQGRFMRMLITFRTVGLQTP